MTQIRQRLLALRDEPYAAFQRRLIPSLSPESIIGVRTPALRALARELAGTEQAAGFLASAPHALFEENQLHAFLLERIGSFEQCLAAVEGFLPFVDNWATCDQLCPPCFARCAEKLREPARRMMADAHPYTVRFGLGLLMRHFLGERFEPGVLEEAAAVRSEEYYVRMMVAWLFATALDRQYDAALPYVTGERLEPWTRRKAIQKALESRRINETRKAELRALRARL